jgi:hypothetical protein
MKTPTTLLLTLLACGQAATALAASDLIIKTGGQMRVQLSVPSDHDVDQITPVTAGRIEIAPIVFVPGFAGRFWLNHVSLNFADFMIERRPFGAHQFRAVGMHLRDAVSFWALEVQPSVYTFKIPPDEITFYSGTLNNGDLQAGNQYPTQDVTGTIDLKNDTFKAEAVILQHGSFFGIDVDGPLTVTLTGVIGPDQDADGVSDGKDNCMLVPNPAQQEIASPVIAKPPTLAFNTCAIPALVPPTAVDVCDGLSVDFTNDAPLTFPVGTTSVNWVGRTPANRVASAIQRVGVADTTPPVFLSVPPPITFTACRPVSIGLAMASDDCDFGGPVVTNNAPARWIPGRTRVTWTARDGAGNRTTATQIVTVTSCTGS